MTAAVSTFARSFPLIYQLATERLKLTLGFLAAVFVIVAVSIAWNNYDTDDLFTKAGPIVGGDFVVFRQAATVVGTPEMPAVYDTEKFAAMLRETYPEKGSFKLYWMYPPTMSFVVAPFALPPYRVSFALWALLFGGLFLFTLSRLWADKWALFFIAASPAAFQAIITGQNGFLTASLIAAAAAFADRRAVLAGIAAGVLTIKPQLGFLIPVAFIAAGCWRAFAVAAATALLLAAASVAAFGTEPWTAFLGSLIDLGGRMGGDGYPFYKLTTPFGFATVVGAPAPVASAVQIAASLALAFYVFVVWRRVRDWDLRLAALATAAVLATPYDFYYELVIVAPAMMLIARRAVETGWLKYERLSLIAVWILPLMMPGPNDIPTCALGAILAFLIAARRVLPAAAITSANGAPPAPAGA